jgi:hypothetical protein
VNAPDILAVLTPIAEELERLHVPYYVGGSVASSVRGVARATADVDLVAALKPEHVQPLVDALQAHYYLDGEMVHDAIRRRSSANVIHLPTMLKADLFVPEAGAYAQEVFRRLQEESLDESSPGRRFPVPSAEDVVLAKLQWYEQGNRVSDRQWYDIVGVLKVQGPSIDLQYLRTWAAKLGLSDVLEHAIEDAGSV